MIKPQIIVMWIMFVIQTFTNLFGFTFIGLVLKWPLVYGKFHHAHPHISDEFYIWGPNNYLNVALIAFAIDMFEPLFLACVWGRARKSVWVGCRYCLLLYSWVCIILVGALCGALIPISMVRTPPDIPCGGAPSPPSQIYEESQVYGIVVAAIILVAAKVVSYFFGFVYAILKVPVSDVSL